MSDVAEVLGVAVGSPQTAASGGAGAQLKAKPAKIKRPPGMSRELFAILRQQSLLPGAVGVAGGSSSALAGDAAALSGGGGLASAGGAGGVSSAPSSATLPAGAGGARMASLSMMDLPSLMPSVAATSTVVQKRRSLAKANRWVWQAFRNPARSDDLELHHWTRVSTADAHGYAFARFNKPVDMFDYTDEEYEAHLQDDRWTRAQTDELMAACRLFDIRWTVVMDRLSFDKFTMEEAKERFYTVEATLARLRAPPDADLTGHPLFAHKYDRQLEEERKRLLDLQLRRTAAQAKADEELLAEAKQILGSSAGGRQRSPSAKEARMPLRVRVPGAFSRRMTVRSQLRAARERLGQRVRAQMFTPYTTSAKHNQGIDEQLTEVKLEPEKLDELLIPARAVHEEFDALRLECMHLADTQRRVTKRTHELQQLIARRDQLVLARQQLGLPDLPAHYIPPPPREADAADTQQQPQSQQQQAQAIPPAAGVTGSSESAAPTAADSGAPACASEPAEAPPASDSKRVKAEDSGAGDGGGDAMDM